MPTDLPQICFALGACLLLGIGIGSLSADDTDIFR
jgi:hypothetical protein